jgi:hypothetical protein
MGFDYLRDNMAIYKEQMVQRGHSFAIVDEVDSILIDEARTPLIISGQGDGIHRPVRAGGRIRSGLKKIGRTPPPTKRGGGREPRRRLRGGREGPHRHPHRQTASPRPKIL